MSTTTPPLAAMVGYTLRTSLPGKRWVGIVVPCGAAVLFGLLTRGLDGNLADDFAEVAAVALFGLIMPVTCLVVGDAVLGAEVRSGSFAFTWLSPVPTWQIALGRWAGGTIVAAGCLALAFSLSAVFAGASDAVAPIAIAAVFGSMAYVAVFLAIGCVAKRAAVWSLAFVFLVERLLGSGPQRHRPAVPRLGGPGRVRRLRQRPRAPRPQRHPPRRRSHPPAPRHHGRGPGRRLPSPAHPQAQRLHRLNPQLLCAASTAMR